MHYTKQNAKNVNRGYRMELSLEQITNLLKANDVNSFELNASTKYIVIKDISNYDTIIRALDVVPETSPNLRYKVFNYLGWDVFGLTKL